MTPLFSVVQYYFDLEVGLLRVVVVEIVGLSLQKGAMVTKIFDQAFVDSSIN